MQVFLQQSLKGILPTAFHATVKKAISRSKLPSKEALRECQVSVDAAYMLHARRFHSATGTAKYMWWDATAHKHDFLLSQVHEVQSDKMCAAMSLLHNLLQHHDRASGKDDSFRRNGRSLNDMIRVHTFPPVVLGLRCSSLEHKVGAFVHALTLEMGGLQGLQQWLSELVSVTSDMGTELGMAEFNMLELAHILPPWMMLQPIQDDAGLPANLTKEKQRHKKQQIALPTLTGHCVTMRSVTPMTSSSSVPSVCVFVWADGALVLLSGNACCFLGLVAAVVIICAFSLFVCLCG